MKYKIIIPKKELINDVNSQSWEFENFEIIKTDEDAKIFVETMENVPEPNDKLKKAFRDFKKQETLEESTFTSTESNLIKEAKKVWEESHPNPIEMALFGAKWQAERMFTEEDVVSILIKAYEDIGKRKIPNQVVLASWFEQFKKK